MIKITIPDNFILERKYIIDVLLEEFLGIKYIVNTGKTHDYVFQMSDGKKLIVKDHFFSIIFESTGRETFLDKKYIPKTVFFASDDVKGFIPEKDIPVIYGSGDCLLKERKIILGIDIFASAFFMLSRWEEYVNRIRDVHDRFPGYASCAYRNQFLQRPVVNEYIELLWNLLSRLNPGIKRKKRKFSVVFSHDVDQVYFSYSIKKFAGDLVKRRSFRALINRAKYLVQNKNPNETYDFLMDCSEDHDSVSRFYFMAGGSSKHDNFYHINDAEIQNIIKRIKDRGHIIGFHPSYNSYNDPEQWKREKEVLENVHDVSVIEGRQHYLRFEVPLTWRIWDENKMNIDSTLMYADTPGFRCGTADEYKVYDVGNRQPLFVKERPLIIMDNALEGYNTSSICECYKLIDLLFKKAIKYRMAFTVLFHNHSFNMIEMSNTHMLYTYLLGLLKS